MRKPYLPWTMGVLVLAAIALMVFVPADSALSQRVSTRLQIDRGSLGVMDASQTDLPLNCSQWHEIWPNYCLQHHQDAYADNGDNVISVCDFVTLDGIQYHVDWVGMTYWLDILAPPNTYQVALEPTSTHDPSNPVCEIWHVVYSDYPPMPVCSTWHVQAWADLSYPYVDDTDTLWFDNGVDNYNGVVVAEGTSISTTPTGGFNIPTLSEWGILVLLLVLVGIGTLFIRRRYRTTNA